MPLEDSSSERRHVYLGSEHGEHANPHIKLKLPEITPEYVLEKLSLKIATLKNENKNTRILEERSDRLKKIFSELGKYSDEKKFVQDVLARLGSEEDKSRENNDRLSEMEFHSDALFVDALREENESRKDSLTGLHNRRGTIETLDMAINHPDLVFGDDLKNLQGKRITVLMTDIDNFGLFNKRYGEGFGDEVLADFSKAMAEGVRDYDIAGRWGGEENVVIFFGDLNPQIADARIYGEVKDFNDDLLKKHPQIQRDQNIEGSPAVTFSAGAVQVEWDFVRKMFSGEIVSDLEGNPVQGQKRELSFKEKEDVFKKLILEKADESMRRAKKEGKNTIRIA